VGAAIINRVGQNHIYIYIYTVYIRCFWQGYHQIYDHIRCIYTVLANPRYTVFWQANPEIYGHIRCIYSVLAGKLPNIRCIYTVLANPIFTVFLAGISSTIRSYTVYIYGSGQPYIYGIFGRDIINYTIIYGVYIRFWPTLYIRYF